MRRGKIFCSIMLIGIMVLSGCGTLPTMTQEEENAIVEYAAGLLIKNMKDYDSRLVDLSLYKDAPEQTENDKEEPGGMDKVEDTEIIDATDEESYGSLDELLMPQGVTIAYTGYHVTESYPENSDGNPFFALDAAPGKKLLVLQFDVTNTTDTEKEVDIFGLKLKCVLTINEAKGANVLSTMLLDDLSTFVDTIEAGEKRAMVLLVEVASADVEEIEGLQLKASTSEGVVTTLLQ